MSSSSAKYLSFFLLLTLSYSLSIVHARDSQFFNKVSTTTNANAIPYKEQPLNNQQQEEPNFLPQNDNGHGLYSQEPENLPPLAAIPDDTESKQPQNKYRPKNYNPVAYVTVPEDVNDSPSLSDETNKKNSNYYSNTQQQEEEEEEYPTTATNNNNNYYSGGSSFNSNLLGKTDTRFMGSAAREQYFNNDGEINRYRPQGMSDTRSLENGKYFYDVSAEKFSSKLPYTSFSGVRARNQYGDDENAYEFNGESSIRGYQNQDEFQDEEDTSLP